MFSGAHQNNVTDGGGAGRFDSKTSIERAAVVTPRNLVFITTSRRMGPALGGGTARPTVNAPVPLSVELSLPMAHSLPQR